MVTPKEDGCICDVCAERGVECERIAMAPGEDLCLPCAMGAHQRSDDDAD